VFFVSGVSGCNQINKLEKGKNLVEDQLKVVCEVIMNKFLGFDLEQPKLALSQHIIHELKLTSNNPHTKMFEKVREEIESLLETQYINFVSNNNLTFF